jgi:methyl-accepting chemotaxis protein
VRAATGISVTAVNRIEATISEVAGVASSIAAAIERQGEATSEIARDVTDAAAGVTAMNARASEVSEEAGVNAGSASEVRDTAVSLNDAIGALKRAVTRIVHTSTGDVDRREAPRIAYDAACRLSVSGRVFNGRSRDMSSGGACVIGIPALSPGVRGVLNIDGIRPSLGVEVRASSGSDELRLVFDLDRDGQQALDALLENLAKRAAA